MRSDAVGRVDVCARLPFLTTATADLLLPPLRVEVDRRVEVSTQVVKLVFINPHPIASGVEMAA